MTACNQCVCMLAVCRFAFSTLSLHCCTFIFSTLCLSFLHYLLYLLYLNCYFSVLWWETYRKKKSNLIILNTCNDFIFIYFFLFFLLTTIVEGPYFILWSPFMWVGFVFFCALLLLIVFKIRLFFCYKSLDKNVKKLLMISFRQAH